jgi:hypothetical protein
MKLLQGILGDGMLTASGAGRARRSALRRTPTERRQEDPTSPDLCSRAGQRHTPGRGAASPGSLDWFLRPIRFTLHRLDGTYQLAEPKTRQSRRTIAIPEIAVTALRNHRVRQAEEKLAVGKG